MPSLHDLQRDFRNAILSGDPTALDALIVRETVGPDDRVDIYRNNVFSSLSRALIAMFPVVHRLVGGEFFAFTAHEFISDCPPDDPRVAAYGGGFADFLADFPPCRDLVYLPDVARLERLLQLAARARELDSIRPSALANLVAEDATQLILRFQPSFGYLSSPFPIHKIWQINQPSVTDAVTVDLRDGGAFLEIYRKNGVVEFRELPEATYAFRAALARGVDLAQALESAACGASPFDANAEFIALFDDGAVVGFDLSRSP